uniref:Fibulin-1 n=1 Tax=Sander lucioperca TaxID=283035 RepID=A0A8D0AM30_SANLU
MARWTIILWSLYGVLHGQEIQLPTIQKCCQDGRTRAQNGQVCTILPLISSSHICMIAQEQCCPWETKISKMCCDCCMLGLMMASQDSNCELQGLLLGRPCAYPAKTCCVTEKPEARDTVTAMPLEGLDPCRGLAPSFPQCDLLCYIKSLPSASVSLLFSDSNCSQLCVDDGLCACLGGYQLQNDGVTCEDVNECLNGGHNCVLGQVCINTEGSFRCQRETSCGTGYELKDDNNCQDINECTLGTHNCGAEFVCTNTEGSFRCHPKERCSSGFIQDAVGSCIDVNECVAHTSPCLPGQTCINTVGSYTCRRNIVTCGRGYHLTEDGTRCEDVDECRTGNVCVNHGCINLIGFYRCECRTGFIFNSITKLCDDINECRHYPGRLCTHKCENTEGSYKCSCTLGFKLSQDNRNCEDVNECEANPCSQECANVYGSYQCYCRRGYQLSDIDGITCDDIDECALPTGGNVCSYRCSNTPGSFYCTCPPTGYTLAHNGRTCLDIDECAAGRHTCSVSESCFNVQGGFRCLSFSSLMAIWLCRAVEIKGLIVHNIFIIILHPFSYLTHISFHTVTAANPAPLPEATSVFFDILAADEQFSFDVEKRSHKGMITGVVRQVKPITGPRDFELKVAMNYVKSGVISHSNAVIIHVFISEFWF